MKKYVFTSIMLLAVVLLCVTLLPVKAQAATSGDYIYEVVDGNATITGYTGEGGDLVIPSELDGYPVTVIGERAFAETKIASVIVPDSVVALGEDAFWFCVQLKSIYIGSGLAEIHGESFEECYRLEKFEVSEENASFSSLDGVLFDKEKTVLYRAPLAMQGEYVVPESVLLIWNYAFQNCGKLVSVVIQDGVVGIGNWAFSQCFRMERIRIPSTVMVVGEHAFGMTDNLQYSTYHVGRYLGNEENPYHVFVDTLYANEEICLVRYGTVVIAGSAFYGDQKMVYLEIPETVLVIGPDAFFNCLSLEAVLYTGTLEQLEQLLVAEENELLYEIPVYYGAPLTVIAGDINMDLNLNNDDVITLMWHVLFPEDNPIYGSGDLNQDGSVDNNDVIDLMWYILFPEDNPLPTGEKKSQDTGGITYLRKCNMAPLSLPA